jgi:hypothetical protein
MPTPYRVLRGPGDTLDGTVDGSVAPAHEGKNVTATLRIPIWSPTTVLIERLEG